MKNTLLAVLLAAGLVPPFGRAFAQAAVPSVDVKGAQQLQRVPVSGLHIGPATHVENPYAGDPNALVEGKRLFQSLNCSGCHAPGGGGGMGPALSDNVWLYGSDPGQVYLSIQHGRPNGMPAWGNALPPQAIWALVAYVGSLSNPSPEFEPQTKLGATPAPGPGNTPHPAGNKQPAPLPKHPMAVPQPPKPGRPSTSGGR
jgi:cytochrome c oxidase cbb3-type subunit 3